MDGRFRSAGEVVSVDSTGITIRIGMNDSLSECSSMCDACGLCHGKKRRHMDVHVPLSAKRAEYSPGDRVMVEYRRRDPALVAVVFFVPPLLGLLIGAGLAKYLWNAGDGGFLVGCLIGLAVGFLIPVFLRQWIRAALSPNAVLVEG